MQKNKETWFHIILAFKYSYSWKYLMKRNIKSKTQEAKQRFWKFMTSRAFLDSQWFDSLIRGKQNGKSPAPGYSFRWTEVVPRVFSGKH